MTSFETKHTATYGNTAKYSPTWSDQGIGFAPRYYGGGAWDVSKAVLKQSFSVSTQDTAPEGLFFKPDGLKMYMLGGGDGDVHQYSLSTAWDISTASFVQSKSVNEQDASPEAIFFKPDGLKMYMLGASADEVNEYDLSTAWDVSTAVFLQVFDITATSDTSPRGLFFKSDGLKMYVSGTVNDKIYEYNLSSAWNVSTLSIVQSISIASQTTIPDGIFFKPDGTKMYLLGGAILEYNLGTAWDISTLSFHQSLIFDDSIVSDVFAVFFKPDGMRMYITDYGVSQTGLIREFSLDPIWSSPTKN